MSASVWRVSVLRRQQYWLLYSIGFWVLTGLALATFSHWPVFSPAAADQGELKLSMAHLTERLAECEVLTPEEVAKLPPNMRVTERCPRERASALLVIHLDGAELLRTWVRPAGFHNDGRVYLQKRWLLTAGDRELRVQLRDSPREDGFDYDVEVHLPLAVRESALLHISDTGVSVLRAADDPPLVHISTEGERG